MNSKNGETDIDQIRRLFRVEVSIRKIVYQRYASVGGGCSNTTPVASSDHQWNTKSFVEELTKILTCADDVAILIRKCWTGSLLFSFECKDIYIRHVLLSLVPPVRYAEVSLIEHLTSKLWMDLISLPLIYGYIFSIKW